MNKKVQRIRFDIPQNPKKKLNLASKINAKHTSDGNSSILINLDWTTQGANIPIALQHHKNAEKYRRMMEQEYEARDLLLPGIDQIIRQSRDLIKGTYRTSPHKAGEWGFKVIVTPVVRKKKKKNTTSDTKKGNKLPPKFINL